MMLYYYSGPGEWHLDASVLPASEINKREFILSGTMHLTGLFRLSDEAVLDLRYKGETKNTSLLYFDHQDAPKHIPDDLLNDIKRLKHLAFFMPHDDLYKVITLADVVIPKNEAALMNAPDLLGLNAKKTVIELINETEQLRREEKERQNKIVERFGSLSGVRFKHENQLIRNGNPVLSGGKPQKDVAVASNNRQVRRLNNLINDAYMLRFPNDGLQLESSDVQMVSVANTKQATKQRQRLRLDDLKKYMGLLEDQAAAKEIHFDVMDLPLTKKRLHIELQKRYPSFERIGYDQFEEDWKVAKKEGICANQRATEKKGEIFLRSIYGLLSKP